MTGIIVIGPKEFLLGFKLAGLKRTYATEKTNPGEIFAKILDDKELGILVTDTSTFSALNEGLKQRLQNSIESTLVVVTEEKGADGGLRKRIKSAMGVDVWGKGGEDE